MKNTIYNLLSNIRYSLTHIRKENLSLSQRLTIEKCESELKVLMMWINSLPF